MSVNNTRQIENVSAKIDSILENFCSSEDSSLERLFPLVKWEIEHVAEAIASCSENLTATLQGRVSQDLKALDVYLVKLIAAAFFSKEQLGLLPCEGWQDLLLYAKEHQKEFYKERVEPNFDKNAASFFRELEAGISWVAEVCPEEMRQELKDLLVDESKFLWRRMQQKGSSVEESSALFLQTVRDNLLMTTMSIPVFFRHAVKYFEKNTPELLRILQEEGDFGVAIVDAFFHISAPLLFHPSSWTKLQWEAGLKSLIFSKESICAHPKNEWAACVYKTVVMAAALASGETPD